MAGVLVVTAATALLTGQDGVWGGLIGFLTGISQLQWLFRDLSRAFEEDMSRMMARYTRSLVIRWSLVAVFVYFIIRYFAQGLVYLVIGLALGILGAILIEILRITQEETKQKEEGGEK